MKRVKIMLTAIGVLAVVGGAVAFKAKTTVGATSYCTTTNTLATICNLATPLRTVIAGSVKFKYVQVPNANVCSEGIPCTLIGTGLNQ